jgi:hypothetical protein
MLQWFFNKSMLRCHLVRASSEYCLVVGSSENGDEPWISLHGEGFLVS